jgi:hypothetical protein
MRLAVVPSNAAARGQQQVQVPAHPLRKDVEEGIRLPSFDAPLCLGKVLLPQSHKIRKRHSKAGFHAHP